MLFDFQSLEPLNYGNQVYVQAELEAEAGKDRLHAA